MCACPCPPAGSPCAPPGLPEDPTLAERHAAPTREQWSVLWARGEGCPELAEILGGGTAARVGPDLRASCLEARADLLVSRRLTSFDLIPVAVPHGFVPGRVQAVVAAVGSGPHSLLAAQVAERIGRAVGAPTTLLTVATNLGADERAEALLEQAAALAPAPERRVVHAANPGAAVRSLPGGTLLVLGVSGGPWWRRQLLGPGHRLRAAAPAGAVVVRSAPRRCFQEMGEPSAMGRQMPAAEALRLTSDPVIPVAEEGRLVGLVRRRTLAAAPPGTPLDSLMEPARGLRLEDPLAAAQDLAPFLEGAPLPVLDERGRLCGLLELSHLRPAR